MDDHRRLRAPDVRVNAARFALSDLPVEPGFPFAWIRVRLVVAMGTGGKDSPRFYIAPQCRSCLGVTPWLQML